VDVGVSGYNNGLGDDIVYVLGPTNPYADEVFVQITTYLSSNNPLTEPFDGDMLPYQATWFDVTTGRGPHIPFAIKCIESAQPVDNDEPAVFVCGSKPGSLANRNYFILGYAKDLRRKVPWSPNRVEGPIWAKEFDYQPDDTILPMVDEATHIDANAAYVVVTGRSQNTDGTFSIQPLVLDRMTGEMAIPPHTLRLTEPGFTGEPVGVRIAQAGVYGDCLFIAGSFYNPTTGQWKVRGRVTKISNAVHLGDATYTPANGARVSASAMDLEVDGLGLYLAGTHWQAAAAAGKAMVMRMDLAGNPGGDWMKLFSLPGGASRECVVNAMSVVKSGPTDPAMIAVTGYVERPAGQGRTDMLTLLYSGIGSNAPDLRWYAVESEEPADPPFAMGKAVVMRPGADLADWRMYGAGFVTNASGNKDWRTLMYKSIEPPSLAYPEAQRVYTDFAGNSGDDEPAAILLLQPATQRKVVVVGKSSSLDTGEDFYSHKYEDTTP
jgi:hypothetical protein